MTHQTIPGHKAHARKVWQWGLDEPNRAARHAAWTGDNPTAARADNPHLRERVYSDEERARAAAFAAWAKANPDKPHSENPHAAPSTLRHERGARS